jgi:hypothetical protein
MSSDSSVQCLNEESSAEARTEQGLLANAGIWGIKRASQAKDLASDNIEKHGYR